MVKSKLVAIVIAMAFMAEASAAWAQQTTSAVPPPQSPPQQGRRGGGAGRQGQPTLPDPTANMTANEIERYFDTFELFQAQNALKLDNASFLTFGARFQQLQAIRRQHQNARRMQIAELNNLLKPEATTDEATLAAKTKALDDIEAQEAQEIQKSLASLDQVLTVVQRARLRTFMFRMEQQKLDMIAEARKQAAKGGETPATPTPVKSIK